MYVNNGGYFRGDNVNITRSNNTPTVDMGTFSIFKLGGSNSSIADINCYDTNVKVDIYDEVTSTVNKNSKCDGNSSPSTNYGSEGQKIIDIGDTRIITGIIRMISGEAELNYDEPFIEIFSANATWKENPGFSYVLRATSDNSKLTIEVTENNFPTKDVNYIVIGRK